MIRRWSSARVSIHVIMYIWYTIIALLLFNRRCCCYSGHCLEFLEKRDNVVLGPFCKTTCTCGALIQARLHVHRATTSATVVFIELAYHDRNKSQWNLLLRVDQLLLGWALQALNYIRGLFQWRKRKNRMKPRSWFPQTACWTLLLTRLDGKKTIFAHSIYFLFNWIL